MFRTKVQDYSCVIKYEKFYIAVSPPPPPPPQN